VKTCRTLAATLALTLVPLAAFAGLGGPKCPPRLGLITLATSSAIGTTGSVEAKGEELRVVVFVDSADNRIYRVNVPDIARAHIGHHVTLVAHPESSRSNTLFVHEIRCHDHR